MNNKMNNYNTKSENLYYLIPLFFVLVLLLFLFIYLLTKWRYIGRKLGCPVENQTDVEEPLIGERVIYRQAWDRHRDSDDEQPYIERLTGRQTGFLVVKRCEQTSTRNVEERIIIRVRQQTQVSSWDRAKDDGQRPVLVFCVISSRIGTDIENAMRGVNDNSRVILVLLHCVLSSLLRGDLSDDEELLDPIMRNRMAGIAHFAFSDREGLYHCHQNTVGFELLSDLVNSID